MKKKTGSLTNPTITPIELSMDTNLPLGGMEFRQGTKNNRQLYHLSEYYNDIITSIDIPDSIKRLRENTFEHCSNLKTITIPKSIKNIDSEAFSNCEGLGTITYKGKAYTSEKELLEDLVSNNVTIGNDIFKNIGMK